MRSEPAGRRCDFCKKPGGTPYFASWLQKGSRSVYAHVKCFVRARDKKTVPHAL